MMELSHLYGVELSRLRNLSKDQQPLRKIHFRLNSDCLPARDSYVDLYVPEFHQYGSRPDRPVRHLDVTSTWRCLSVAHAEELKFWEEMFASVLEYTVSNHLIDLIDGMDDCNVDRFPGDLDTRICSFTNNMGGKTFAVNVREIVGCMLELFKRHGNQHQWLASSGNFFNALCEFLRTRDCFLDTPLHPTVKVTFSASLSAQGEPSIVGKLKRFGPMVGFSRLDAFTCEDAYCHIYPSYTEPVLDPGYPSFIGQPEYRLTSDWIKFNWDHSVQGFSGYIRPNPKCEDEPNIRLKVDLTAITKRFFPGGVAFERNLRVRIKLSICRFSKVSTASMDETFPHLERCPVIRKTLVHPPPALGDLGGIMNAKKRSAASSPAKTTASTQKNRKTPESTKFAKMAAQKDLVKDLLERTRPETRSTMIEVNAMVEQADSARHRPSLGTWGANVPAWDTLPDQWTQRAESPSAIAPKLHRDNSKRRARARGIYPNKPTPTPSQSHGHSKRPSTSISPFSLHKQQPANLQPWSVVLERLAHDLHDLDGQPYRLSSSPSASTRFGLPASRETLLSPNYLDNPTKSQPSDNEELVYQPLHAASSRDISNSTAPLEMKHTPRATKHNKRDITTPYPGPPWSPEPPATAPPCPAYPHHTRHDSAVGIRRKVSSAELLHSPLVSAADTDSGLQDSFATGLTQHQSFAPDGRQSAIDAFQREIRNFYDMERLRKDTPRKLTREERSEEEAFSMAFVGDAFVGDESGDEGDVDEDV